MVVTLLGALIGFIGSALPECFSFLKAWQDGRQEIAIFKLQITAQAQAQAGRLEEINAYADVSEALAVRTPMALIGNRFIDGLNASVRPVLAYGFFVLYASVKAAQFHMLTHGIAPLPWLAGGVAASALVSLWTQEDAAILAAIISFYFGGRALEKARNRP